MFSSYFDGNEGVLFVVCCMSGDGGCDVVSSRSEVNK